MFLKNLEAKGAINIISDNGDNMEVMVDGNRKVHVEKLLQARSISYSLTKDKTPPAYYPSSPLLSKARPVSVYSKISYSLKKIHQKTLDWRDFYPLHVIYSFLTDLEKQYPSICTVISIGKTVEGREIKLLKISNSNAGNTGIWIDGAIHAREWISASVVTYIANHVAYKFNKGLPHITSSDWFLAPVLNPDGYEYSQSTDRMWRKNRSRIGGKPCGVDLNRNFGNTWGYEKKPLEPTHLNYSGPEPFSEPECVAVKNFILYSGIPFKIFVTFHAFSELISFPWCFTNEPCDDYVSLLEGATVMAKAIFKETKRIYKVGNFRDLMYYATGTSIDWSYGVANIPFSYLVELRSKEHKFLLPKDQISDCCRESCSAVMALVDFVQKITNEKGSTIPKRR